MLGNLYDGTNSGNEWMLTNFEGRVDQLIRDRIGESSSYYLSKQTAIWFN
jgi:hypothetical protein